ncbi:ECF-type sigma factor [Aerococcaceae bacterium NML160702]|nr:ECF-type sigma factor [Aerococcaceae bacterium NML190073]MCW6681529.1 ECF-type sigma factor [Aerococcaceae bacterium NML160702]
MKFDWLKDYKEVEERIAFLKWNLSKSKAELERWLYGDLAKVAVTKGSLCANLEKNIAAMEEELKNAKQHKIEVEAIVDSFNGIEHKIVKMKYIEGYSLEEIAEMLNYSYTTIKRKHSRIRQSLNFLYRYEENIKKYRRETPE